MKISQLKSITTDTNTGALTAVGRNGIEFEKVTNGSYKAVVPVKLPNSGGTDTRTFTTSVPVDVTSETSRNKEGRRRLMIKASMPYVAINPDVDNTAVVANVFDAARSGGENSFHIVGSIAKQAIADLSGARGTLAQRCAAAQILAPLKLMLSFIQGLADGGETLLGGTLYPVTGVDIGDTGPGTGLCRFGAESTANIQMGSITGFASDGLDLSGLADLGALLDNPIVRGLNGLEPIDSSKEYIQPHQFQLGS